MDRTTTECLLCHASLSPLRGRRIDEEVRKLLQDNMLLAAFENISGDEEVCSECFSSCEELRGYYAELQKVQEAIQKLVACLKLRLSSASFDHNYGTRNKGRRRKDTTHTRHPSLNSSCKLKQFEIHPVPSLEVKEERVDPNENDTILGIDSSEFCDMSEEEMMNIGPVDEHELHEGPAQKDIKEEILPGEIVEIKEEFSNESESSMDCDDTTEFNLNQILSDSESNSETETKKLRTMQSIVRDILLESKSKATESDNRKNHTRKANVGSRVKTANTTSTKRIKKTKSTKSQTPRTTACGGKQQESECDLCDPKKIFTSTVKLSIHYEIDHRDTEKVFLCEKFGCNEKLLTYDLLDIHKRSHYFTGERNMIGNPMFHRAYCNICPLSSYFPDELRNHELEKHSDELNYKCDICDSKYYTECIRGAHKLAHSNPKEFEKLECSLCPKEWKINFPDKESFESHLIRIHNFPLIYLRKSLRKKYPLKKRDAEITCEKCGKFFPEGKRFAFCQHKCEGLPFRCELCNKMSDNRLLNISHTAAKHEGEKNKSQWNPSLKCQKCKKQFATTFMYKRHINCHNLESKFKFYCSTCEERFATESLFSQHIKYRHNPEPQAYRKACDECGKEFPTLIKIRKHEREEHSYLFTFVCTKCEATFSKSEFLETHLRTHEASGPYVCSLCPKKFHLTGEQLETHLKIVHTEGRGKRCPTCGEVFPNNNYLAVHRSAKHGEAKSLECSICSQRFNSKRGLERHTLSNHASEDMKRKKAEEKRVQCEICQKWLSGKTTLHGHIRTVHERSTVQVCETCGKSINGAQAMKDHMKIHREEKNFACSFCDKRFVRRDALRMHTYTHTGEKPFGCHICDKRFNQRTPLRRHVETHKKDSSWFPKPDSNVEVDSSNSNN